MSLPPQVHEVAQTYLRLVDEAAPGLVEGLYFHGSVALGDFRADHSDIDFVALTPGRPGGAELVALEAVHKELERCHPRPYFDGIYLTRDDLVAGPDRCPDVPGSHEASFAPTVRFMLCPVTWHELDEHGVVVRGPALAELDLWTDKAALLDFTRTNLQTYWRGWVDSLDRVATAAPDKAFDPWLVEWCVLGAVRLHALLATGALHSKGGAGRWAVEALDPRWRPILSEALRIRAGDTGPSSYADLRERLRETREFVATIVDTDDT
ncbi:aminoglycoside adenylyltransferase domain-containing protein [Actinopolymorpha pittospori]